jgi:hypothetical protein
VDTPLECHAVCSYAASTTSPKRALELDSKTYEVTGLWVQFTFGMRREMKPKIWRLIGPLLAS